MEKSVTPIARFRGLARQAKAVFASLLRALPFSSETLGPPKGVIPDTARWIESLRQTAASKAVRSWIATEPRVISRRLPTLPDSQTIEAFRPFLHQTHPPGQVWEIAGARVLNLCILSPDDRIFMDLSLHRNLRPEELQWALSRLKLPPVETVKGKLVLIGESFAGTYYHWLFLAIGRLAHIRERFPLESIEYFSVSHHRESFHGDTLRMLGIGKEKILHFKDHPHVRPDAVIATPWTGGFDPTVAEFLRESFLPHGEKNPGFPKRIYVSRARSGRRHIENEKEFLAVIQGLGFQTVFTEELSFAQQIALFRDADAIIGPHGAGLANLAFCRPQTKVIELFNEGWRPEIFWQLSSSMDLDHYALLGQDVPTGEPPGRAQDRNFSVGISELKALLKKAGLTG